MMAQCHHAFLYVIMSFITYRKVPMAELDGFHLRFILADDDRSLLGAAQHAELRALLQPLSANDSDASGCLRGLTRINADERLSTSVFIPFMQATDPTLWGGVANWIQGQPGRTLRLRFKHMEGDAQSLEEIPPLLEKTLKELTAIVRASRRHEIN